MGLFNRLFSIFKKMKTQEPEVSPKREERSTRCDECEFLFVCKPDLLNVTLISDSREHFRPGPGTRCRKDI